MPRHVEIQNSFNAGEFSHRMFGRTDLQKYASAARLIENFQIVPQGGLERRSGTRYVAEAASLASKSRLVAFVFSDIQSYVLEFSDLQVRFFRDEGQLVQQTLTNILPAEEVSITSEEFTVVGHGYNNDEGPVKISSTGTIPGGLSAVASYWMRIAETLAAPAADWDDTNDWITIANHDLAASMGPYQLATTGTLPTGLTFETDYYLGGITTNTFQIALTPGGGAVNFTSQGTGTHSLVPTAEYKRNKFRFAGGPGGVHIPLSGTGTGLHTITPTTPLPITLASPYRTADLDALQFAQSADVLYIAHKDYAPRALSRFSLQGFSLEPIVFEDGPYLDENVTATTLATSALTGQGVTLTSVPALFKGTDVGRLVRILDDDTTNDLAWGVARIVSVNPDLFTDADVTKATLNASPGGTDLILNEVVTGTHGMNTGDVVGLKAFSGGILPVPLLENTPYFVRAVSTTRLAFFPTKAGALADDATRIILSIVHTDTVRVTANLISNVAHGFLGGEGPLTLSNVGGALPEGLNASTDYYIGPFIDVDTLSLSLSRGGDPVGIFDAETGGGQHSIQGLTVAVATCTANVLTDFQRINNPVTTWRMGAWGSAPDLGFPRAVTFHEERLWWASNRGEPQKLWSSKTADFLNMGPTGNAGDGDVSSTSKVFSNTVYDDNAVTHEIGANKVNVILWMRATRTLVLGTSSSSWTASAALISEAITPGNFQVKQASAHGSSTIGPVTVDDRILYVSDTQQKVFSLGYSFESDNYVAEDLTLLADHIGRGDIVGWDYAHEPFSTVWAVKGDGTLVALTLVREQQIAGWQRHSVGGVGVAVESIAVISSPLGDASSVGRVNRNHDQVWISVKRTVDGVTKRFIEFVEDIFEDDDLTEDSFFVDAGITYNGAATLTPGPFPHLANEVVDVLADGQPILAQTLSATGALTLAVAAAKVHVGYTLTSRLQSLRLPLRGPEGTAEVNLKRFDHLVIRFDNTLQGEYGVDEANLFPLGEVLLGGDEPMDVTPAPFSGDKELSFEGIWETYGNIFIRQAEPLPMSILAVAPRGQSSARGDRR